MFALRHLRQSSEEDDRQSEWQIETADLGPVDFPPDNQLKLLFKEHIPALSDLTIKERGGNYLVIRTPAGLMPQNGGLLKAIWDKSIFR
jgi:hypothetical protein